MFSSGADRRRSPTKAPKVDKEILAKSIAEAAAGLLADGMAPAESLKSEVALRGGMLGIPADELPSQDKVFDYSFAGKVAK